MAEAGRVLRYFEYERIERYFAPEMTVRELVVNDDSTEDFRKKVLVDQVLKATGETHLIMILRMFNHNRKAAILLIFSFFISAALPAQEELSFIAERDTIAVREGNELLIHAGLIITIGNSRQNPTTVSYGQIYRFGEFHLTIRFGERNNIHWAFAKNFRPLNTVDVFGEDIFIDYPMDRIALYSIDAVSRQLGAAIEIGDSDAMWVPSFYQDVLRAKDRDMLISFVPFLYDDLNYDGFIWYESTIANIQHGRAMFYNSAIGLGTDTHLAVRNIRRTDFGYIAECNVSIRDVVHLGRSIFPMNTFLEQYKPGDAVTLYLYLDNDYLDIYTSSDIHVGTFIRVGREFIAQYQRLILTNTADLINVQWPKRAGD